MFANQLLVTHLPPPGRGVSLPEMRDVEGSVVFVRVASSPASPVSSSPPGAASSSPSEALALANLGMEVIVPEVFVRGGMIGRFTEHGVLALFQGDDHLERAVSAAVSARSEVERRLRREQPEIAESVSVTAGVGSGRIALGAVGAKSLRRMEYVLFGAPVETAMTLARHAERGQVLLEDELSERLGPSFETRALPSASLPGRHEPTALTDVLAHRTGGHDGPASTLTTAFLNDQSMVVETSRRNGTTDP